MWKRDVVTLRKYAKKDNNNIKKFGITKTDSDAQWDQGNKNCQRWLGRRKNKRRHINANPQPVIDDFIHQKFKDVTYGELLLVSNKDIFNKARVFEIKLPDVFAHHVREDLKATDFFNEIRTLIGVSKLKSDGNVEDICLKYNRFWNLVTRPQISVENKC